MIKDKENTNLIENNELALELYKAYKKLSKNKDFITLIEKGFMDTFVRNQVSLMAHPVTITTMKEGSRDRLIDNILAVSVLENWLLTVEILGEKAEKAKLQSENLDDNDDIQTLEEEVGI